MSYENVRSKITGSTDPQLEQRRMRDAFSRTRHVCANELHFVYAAKK